MSNEDLPVWIIEARQKWRFTGSKRPDFAVSPGPGQKSVWDYPRPPGIAPESRRVRIAYQGRLIADSSAALKVMETAGAPTIYLPPAGIAFETLVESNDTSWCEWKGCASWFDLELGNGLTLERCAWSYLSPFPPFEMLAGFVAFYPHRLACFLNDERVRPQPGSAYGGWITSELVGPFKGLPGTEWW